MKLKTINNRIEKIIEAIASKPFIYLTLIVIINILLKGFYLGDASMWLDEVSQVNLSIKPVNEIIKESLEYPNAPVYTLLLSIWIKFFGISPIATRALSLLISVATIPAIFHFAKRHLNSFTAIFSTLLFSVSNLQLYYSHEVRSYTLVGLLVVISCNLFLNNYKRTSLSNTILLCITNTLLLYTHLTAILIFVAQALFGIWHLRDKKKTLHAVVSVSIPIALLSIWFLSNSWFGGNETVWLGKPTIKDLLSMFFNLLNDQKVFLVSIFLTIGGIFFYFKYGKIDNNKIALAIFLGAWGIAPVIISYISSIFYNPRFIPRYILYTSIGLFLFISYASSVKKFPNTIKIPLLLIIIVYSGLKLNLSPWKGENWKDAVASYKNLDRRNSATIVSAWYQWLPFSYYYSTNAFMNYKSTLNILSKEAIFFTNGKEILNSVQTDTLDQIILVLSHYGYADPNRTLVNEVSSEFGDPISTTNHYGVEILVFKKDSLTCKLPITTSNLSTK
ncbi:MAG: glycosyltransferase family 39 protein [Tenuifilaceae bacterium]|jgi:4-amino-4-deoxy-L-arabinose transferase-like glycosyltransferase|nr:glycosyltransferase family 39 protein [Tenuifilaceae bacterium]